MKFCIAIVATVAAKHHLHQHHSIPACDSYNGCNNNTAAYPAEITVAQSIPACTSVECKTKTAAADLA